MIPLPTMAKAWGGGLLALVVAEARSFPCEQPDTAAFAAVVRAAIAQNPFPIQVDPHPLSAAADITRAVDATRAPVTDDELAARSALLARLGVSVGDPFIPGHCAGMQSPPGAEARSGCPATQVNVISIGTPRPDFSAGVCRKVRRCTRWLVRVIDTTVGPSGFTVLASDYSMEQRGPRWAFVKKQLLTWME